MTKSKDNEDPENASVFSDKMHDSKHLLGKSFQIPDGSPSIDPADESVLPTFNMSTYLRMGHTKSNLLVANNLLFEVKISVIFFLQWVSIQIHA